MNKNFEMVREFHEAMNQPVANKPIALPYRRKNERYAFMLEEVHEFQDATTIVDQTDAMIDLIYLALGTLVEIGVKPESLFEIVHHANMSKLWEDGKPRIDENGKVIKPPDFVAPEPLLYEEIERQGGSHEIKS